jgi:hypothetical protein
VTDQAVVYAAQTSQQAHLLKNLLEEAGIRAIVTNDLLQGGSGVDILGWPSLARVVVSEADAPAARRIAREFDQRTAAPTPPAEGPMVRGEPGTWPTCPQCGRRRLTRCPACGTSGTDFVPADLDVSDTLGLADVAGQGPCCGPGGCTPTASPIGAEASSPGPAPSLPDTARALLLCPTCDEPFAPQYLRQCEWCGHEFADGYEIVSPSAAPETQLNARVQVTIVAIVVLAIALAAYLASLFR